MDVGCSLYSMTGAFIRRGEDREIRGEEGHVKTEVEIGVILPQTKEHLGPLEEDRKDSSPESTP